MANDLKLKPLFEEAKEASRPKGTITIRKDASNRDLFIQFYKSLLKKDDKQQEIEPGQTPTLAEMAPLGREKQVKKLKKLIKKGGKKGGIPKSYKAKGKTKKSNPFAMAWAQHNKTKEEAKKEPDETDPNPEDKDEPLAGNERLPSDDTEEKDTSKPHLIQGEEQEEKGSEEGEQSTTGDAEPGKIPPKPKTEPELYGPDAEIFEAEYKVVDFGGNYDLEIRRKILPDGKVKAELIFWEVGQKVKKGEKPENLKFHSSVIMIFDDKTSFKTMVEHWRWKLGQFNNQLKARP